MVHQAIQHVYCFQKVPYHNAIYDKYYNVEDEYYKWPGLNNCGEILILFDADVEHLVGDYDYWLNCKIGYSEAFSKLFVPLRSFAW